MGDIINQRKSPIGVMLRSIYEAPDRMVDELLERYKQNE